MTGKPGPGRPPGKYGPYRSDDERRERFMIRLPAWLIAILRELTKKQKTSAGKLIEKALVSEYGVNIPKTFDKKEKP